MRAKTIVCIVVVSLLVYLAVYGSPMTLKEGMAVKQVPSNQITTDIPIVISNPHAAQPYLQMGKEPGYTRSKNTDLIHSSKKNANFIFRKPPGSSYSANHPLHYTDTVCIQWAAANNGESEDDQPNSNSSNCGWYGCSVLQPPNAQNSGLNPKFDQGGTNPAVFMLMAPPSVVLAKGVGAPTAIQAKLPIYSGDPFCLQYVGTGAINWGFTGNCGWFGCRILADYLGDEPTLGEFGWQHGGGTGVVTSPTGWPKGPTVFTVEMNPAASGVPPPSWCIIPQSLGTGIMTSKNVQQNVTVGPSNTIRKTIQLNNVKSCSATPVNPQSSNWLDTFSVDVGENELTVTRIDNSTTPNAYSYMNCASTCPLSTGKVTDSTGKYQGHGWWGQDLELSCEVGDGCSGKLAPGATCNVKCEPGYNPTDGATSYKCSKSGKLTSATVGCVPQTCQVPKLGDGIIGGKTNPCKEGDALANGKSCSIVCKPGYKLSGGAIDTYSCANGKLALGNIQCKPITCNLPITFGAGIESGAGSPCYSSGILNVNESCDVTCAKGYKVGGGTTAYTCDSDGVLKGASLTCNKIPGQAHTNPAPVKELPSQVTCICETPSVNPSCPAHRNYTHHDHQYGLGHKSGYDRYHHEHDVVNHHQEPQSSRRRVPNTYDDYYRTTSFPPTSVKPYNSLMNLFL